MTLRGHKFQHLLNVFSLQATSSPNRVDFDEELQVNLITYPEKVLSSRSLKISDSTGPASLQISLKSSALKMCRFLEHSSIKIGKNTLEEKEISFLELPDRLATSSDIEFSTTNQSNERLKLNILMYFQTATSSQGKDICLDEELRRKFELSTGDQRLLPSCWSMMKKQDQSRLIQLSPTSSPERLGTTPLDLTRKAKPAPSFISVSGLETQGRIRLKSPVSALLEELNLEQDQISHSKLREAHGSNQVSSADSDLGQMKDVGILAGCVDESQVCESAGLSSVLPFVRSSISVGPSFTTKFAGSTLRKYLYSKRPLRSSKLEEEIKALEKSLGDMENKLKLRKTETKSVE